MNNDKLTINGQIEHMKEEGITFKNITEGDAKNFLEHNTYYFKIKAYKKDFEVYTTSDKKGKFVNLDFAYLKDISTIDAHLRKIILSMCLDLEHYLKVNLISDFTKCDEDGHEIIQEYFTRYSDVQEDIRNKGRSSACEELVSKYIDNFSLWNIVEVLSFRQFIDLYNLFYDRNKTANDYRGTLFSIRKIRNAAAHNNCLIHKLRPPYNTVKRNRDVSEEIASIPGISRKSIEKWMSHPTIHDFIVLLYTYTKVVPNPTKEKALIELSQLVDVRMPREKEYYKYNGVLISAYNFVKIVVDYYKKTCI